MRVPNTFGWTWCFEAIERNELGKVAQMTSGPLRADKDVAVKDAIAFRDGPKGKRFAEISVRAFHIDGLETTVFVAK